VIALLPEPVVQSLLSPPQTHRNTSACKVLVLKSKGWKQGFPRHKHAWQADSIVVNELPDKSFHLCFILIEPALMRQLIFFCLRQIEKEI
jgi:hypothetical protein